MSDKKFMSYGDAETVFTEFADNIKAKEPLVFKGTQAEWDALTEEEKSNFELVCLTDDSKTGETVDAVTDGDMRAVTSNAVYNAINSNPQIKKFQSGIWTGVVAIASQTKQTITITMPEAMPSTNYFVVLACPDISIWGIFKSVVSTTQFNVSLYNFHTAAVNAQNITWNAIELG